MQDDARLSRIETLWSVVQQANQGDESLAQAAQEKLLDRYGGAVRRYLLVALRNPDAVDEVFQEFALKFVRGDFRRASPQRGRFRSFVKTCVYHLIVDYQRRSKREHRDHELAVGLAEEQTPSLEQVDVEFTASWRSELLAQAWGALQEREKESGKPYYTVLRFRADHPGLPSPELAEELSRRLNRSINAGNVRVLVHRAREMFAELLVETIEGSLENSSVDEVEGELIALDLHSYCRPSLAKRREQGNR